MGDARAVVTIVRSDVERVSDAAHALGEQLRDAADTTMRRVDDVNAVLDVLQDELEDTALTAVSAIRGVRAGAVELTTGRRRSRSRRPPTAVDDDTES